MSSPDKMVTLLGPLQHTETFQSPINSRQAMLVLNELDSSRADCWTLCAVTVQAHLDQKRRFVQDVQLHLPAVTTSSAQMIRLAVNGKETRTAFLKINRTFERNFGILWA